MKNSRRQFIVACTTMAAGLTATPAVLLGLAKPSEKVPLDELGLAHFTAHLNSAFQVADATGRNQVLTLCDASAYAVKSTAQMGPGPFEGFSLMFRGLSGRRLEQNTYCFSHKELGCFEMFIVPVGSPGTGLYQAVFNRPKRSLDSQPV